MTFDKEKFKTLVHYIVWKAGRLDRFGATKLNKVLWFADARTFVLTGKSITGATYIREKYGPVPHQIMPIRAELVRDGAISVAQSRGDGNHTRFTALFAPTVWAMSSTERETVDYWIEHIDKDHTATSISEQSHDYAWEIAREGEELPLVAILANRIRDPNEKELAWARASAAGKKLP